MQGCSVYGLVFTNGIERKIYVVTGIITISSPFGSLQSTSGFDQGLMVANLFTMQTAVDYKQSVTTDTNTGVYMVHDSMLILLVRCRLQINLTPR